MKLSHSFYKGDTLTIAKNLLGKILVHEVGEQRRSGMIVEVEAYRGTIDKAAHSYSGKPTVRTKVMFGPPGHAYVYLIYGMYHCLNVVTAPAGTPEAILIRAIEPLEGIAEMAIHRFGTNELTKQQQKNLTNGPGKLAKALGVTKEQNGVSLLGNTLYIEDAPPPSYEICTGPRINIDYAEEAVHFPWRFYLKNHPCVSR